MLFFPVRRREASGVGSFFNDKTSTIRAYPPFKVAEDNNAVFDVYIMMARYLN